MGQSVQLLASQLLKNNTKKNDPKEIGEVHTREIRSIV